MKTVKGNIEMLSLRKEIPIEELKERKRNLDLALTSLTLSEHTEQEIKDWAELTDTAIFYHAKWKQEHNLACDLAKALLKILALSENEELKQEYIKLLEKARKNKCFEFTDEDYKKLGIEKDDTDLICEIPDGTIDLK